MIESIIQSVIQGEEDVTGCVRRLVEEREGLLRTGEEQGVEQVQLKQYILDVEMKLSEVELELQGYNLTREKEVMELNGATERMSVKVAEVKELRKELSRVLEENECYQSDIASFITKLNAKDEECIRLEVLVTAERSATETLQACLVESSQSISELRIEIQEIQRTARMKEDVITSLQSSIESNNEQFSQRLSASGHDVKGVSESLEGNIGQVNEAILKMMDSEISKLDVENERKGDIAIHLMKEIERLKTLCDAMLAEMQSKESDISTLHRDLLKRREDEKKLLKQINDNETVIEHLAGVVNQHAYGMPIAEKSNSRATSVSFV